MAQHTQGGGPTVVRLPVGDDPPTARLYYGQDNRDVLARMPSRSVHVICTSPPYWGLRNYGTPPLVFGGQKGCAHRWGDDLKAPRRGSPGSKTTLEGTQRSTESKKAIGQGAFCLECGAWKGDLGLEPSPKMYIEHMVEVFREVHRVLRDDGTLWLNIGDTYWGGGSTTARSQDPNAYAAKSTLTSINRGVEGRPVKPQRHATLKPKDLVGIPWRLAIALQDDGWWLRNDVIWSKSNRLPHPVKDRLSSSHEHIFLLTKSRRYYFNLDAIRISQVCDDEDGDEDGETHNQYNAKGKNPGDVWVFPTQPFPGAHFAVFPPALPERCILAGTSNKGVCSSCATPWHLVKEYGERDDSGASSGIAPELGAMGTRTKDTSGKGGNVLAARPVLSEEWTPACECGDELPVRSTILDPFSGSGTTGMVALELGQDYVGIDLNDGYLPMASARVIGEKPPEEPLPIEEGSVLDLFGDSL